MVLKGCTLARRVSLEPTLLNCNKEQLNDESTAGQPGADPSRLAHTLALLLLLLLLLRPPCERQEKKNKSARGRLAVAMYVSLCWT